MKTFRYLFIALLASATLFAACTKATPEEEGEKKPGKSKACKITSFKLHLSDGTILDGDIYDYEEAVEVTYKSTIVDLLKNATAEITVSDKATLSPDPTIAADYSLSSVRYTVTAEDGSIRNYTVYAKERLIKIEHKFEEVWNKTIGQIDMPATVYNDVAIAMSGPDHFVLGDGVVYDKMGNKVGTVNTTGMPDTKFVSMTNDNNGVLLASINAAGNAKPHQIWMWKNGYSSAPELRTSSTSEISKFISITGDVNGAACLSALGARTPIGPHFSWSTTDGWATQSYKEIKTNTPSNDGTWTQMISTCDPNPNGYIFFYDSQANSCRGFVMANADTAPIALLGPGNWYPGIAGVDGWGNYTRGSARAFTFDGKPYAVICTTTWAHTYFTVVDPIRDNDLQLFVEPQGGDQVCPSAAYIYNQADQCGYIYMFSPKYSVCCYKVTRVEIEG